MINEVCCLTDPMTSWKWGASYGHVHEHNPILTGVKSVKMGS